MTVPPGTRDLESHRRQSDYDELEEPVDVLVPAVKKVVGATPTSSHTRKQLNLEETLTREGSGFEFVQILRLLQRMYPEREPVGVWSDPENEVARMHVLPSLAFPPSEVSAVEIETSADPNGNRKHPVHVGVRFFGLVGPQGVLPHAYTEHAAARARARDTAFRDFLDLFHHRTLSLFYRAWERHHTAAVAERGGEDRLRSHLLDLAGAGNPAGQRQSTVHPDTLAYYAGLFGLRSRPAMGLAQLIGDYFDVSVTAEQFVGEWRTLASGGQVRLDGDGTDGRLGKAVIGSAVYDPHARIRLRIGPISREQFDRFLPDGRDHVALKALAGFYVDDEVGVDAQLVLACHETPVATLGVAGAPRLGFGTWFRNKAPTRDPDDVLFNLCL